MEDGKDPFCACARNLRTLFSNGVHPYYNDGCSRMLEKDLGIPTRLLSPALSSTPARSGSGCGSSALCSSVADLRCLDSWAWLPIINCRLSARLAGVVA